MLDQQSTVLASTPSSEREKKEEKGKWKERKREERKGKRNQLITAGLEDGRDP
jgi:hypothetical protein